MNDNLQGLLEQAQKMQQSMQDAQKELAELEVEGTSGAGLVTVKANGRYQVNRVVIDPSLLAGDKKVLEDLVRAAVNDAVTKVEEGSRQKVAEITSGLNLPQGLAGFQGDQNKDGETQ